MATIRRLIFEKLEEILNTVTAAKEVSFGLPIEAVFPALGIVPLQEDTENEPDDIYIEVLKIAVRVVVDDNDEAAGYHLEDILADVHRAVLADSKIGGLADNIKKEGTRWGWLDPKYPFAGADLLFEIRYQTEEKDPSDSNFDQS